LTTQRGVIQITTPAAWRACAGTEPPDLRRGTRLAAVRFAARHKAAALAALKTAGIAASERDGKIVVPPDAGHGATLIFERPIRRVDRWRTARHAAAKLVE
jgi:hypothetical protein